MGKARVLLATFATTALVSGCHVFEVACPAIAQASGVSVTVAASYAPAVQTLHLKACQEGVCRESDLVLVPGSISVDLGCVPYAPEPGIPKPGIPGQGVPGAPGTGIPEPAVPGAGVPPADVPGTAVPPTAVPPTAVPEHGGRGPDMPCSATASPDGTKRGMLVLDILTESPMDVTASGTSIDGSPLPVRTVRFTPRGDYPFGQPCGRLVSASVVLDETSLRQDR
ncbi:hypothetical protein [Arthrobacter sp. ZGTC131]|uniref:hypothetical protein n=1 Tax=Arthrobacter sp. ZGTC131 TaxID=2058898 RepID=UPI0015E42AAE|nr:hypothetical protein [Arthrobacter sp. ZGTC131]